MGVEGAGKGLFRFRTRQVPKKKEKGTDKPKG